MPAGYCSVFGCNNTSTDKISLHRIPKDANLRKIWIARLYRKDKFSVDNVRICSEHFLPEDFERDLRNELLNLPIRKILKKGSVPQSKSASQLAQSESRRSLIEKRKRKLDILVEGSPEKRTKPATVDVGLSVASQANLCSCSDSLVVISKLQSKIAQQAQQIETLTRRLHTAYQMIEKKSNSKILSRVSGVFGSGTAQFFKTGRRPGRWSLDDLHTAVSIRAISHKAYLFLRSSLCLPLPSPATLYRFTKRFDCEPGVMQNVLRLLKHFTVDFSLTEKLTVLSFDEMSVKAVVEYDRGNDRVYGPHTQVQVAMIRGLVKPFKQPVFFEFDTKMTVEILRNIISSVEACGLHICACVSDMGGTNRKLWKDLGVTEEKVFINHPVDSNRKLHFFADMPHILKLYRNHVLDRGISCYNSVLDKSIFEAVLKRDNTELKFSLKMSQRHIDVARTERQNVCKAAQVLSGTTTDALGFLAPEFKAVAAHVRAVNSAFDVLNSRTTFHKNNPIAGAFGTQYDQQIESLAHMEEILVNSRVVGKKQHLPFQKGFLLTIRSLRSLYVELKSVYNVRYILTSRLNQDLLENLFSQVRGAGAFYDHPSPVSVKHRLKTLLIGAKSSIFTTTAVATDDHASSEYTVTSELFRRAFNDETLDQFTTTGDDEALQQERQAMDPATITENEEQVIYYIGGYVAKKTSDYFISFGNTYGSSIKLRS